MDYALRSVLIVDDTQDIRELLSIQVEMIGLEAVSVSNGRQALELLHSRPFDMVLLDIMMPEVNGYQVLEEMSADPALRSIPVIVCSILPQKELALSLGAAGFLQKPISQDALIEALERLNCP